MSGGFIAQPAEVDGLLVTVEGTFSDELSQVIMIHAVLFEGYDGDGTRM
jgi:hypothetical protein